MTEELENQTPEILEGEHNSPIQKERYFRSLSALTDFVNSFKIESGAFGRGMLDGQECFVLQYRKREE